MSRVVSFCDKTGNMVRPWAEAGYDCTCVDVQHSIRRVRETRVGQGVIRYVWGDVRSWAPPSAGRIAFFSAFSPCTHVAGSGARDFRTKGIPLLTDALELFNASRVAAQWSGAPWMLENPVGVLSSIPHVGPPDAYFEPWHYAALADEPEAEAYTKKTCLWIGGGFVMPARAAIDPIHGSKMHLLPPSDDRSDLRSATPTGLPGPSSLQTRRTCGLTRRPQHDRPL